MVQSFIAELVVSHPDLPLIPTSRDAADATVTVESQPLTYPDRPGPIVFYSVADCAFEDFESALDTDHTVDEWRVAMEFTDCHIYQVYHSSSAKFTTPEIADLGLQVLSIRNSDGGWQFRLHAPDRDRLGDYWEYCREQNVQFDLERIYTAGPQAGSAYGDSLEAALTERQREVARTAARMRYYEPEGASAEEVADELDISPSTLSTHLRRVMAKVLRQLFAE